MKRKYCPTCYLEHHELVEVALQKGEKKEKRRAHSKPSYQCVKRGHVIKGAGLTLPELTELERFYGEGES